MSAAVESARAGATGLTARALPAVILLAAALPGVAHAMQRNWWPTLVVCACGLLWLIGSRSSRLWSAGIGLPALTASAVWGLEAGWPPVLALLVVVLALLAWDLHHYAERWRRAAGPTSLERRHQARLLAVAACGLLVGVVALEMSFGLDFALALFLVGLAILGLSRVVIALRRASEPQ